MRLQFELDELGSPVGLPVASPGPATLPNADLIVEGAYARLEPLRAEVHGHQLWEAFGEDREGRNWTYLGVGPFSSDQEFTGHLSRIAASSDPFFYAIIDKHSGLAVGYASYLRIDPNARSIEVGWITYSPRVQRTRVATDSMYLMMRTAFELGYRRYEWKCNALNAPSIAAAQRLGFSFEGLFRQALVVKGRNRDSAWFSVIDGDWPRLRSAFERWLGPDNFDAAGQQRERLSDLTASVVASRWPQLVVDL